MANILFYDRLQGQGTKRLDEIVKQLKTRDVIGIEKPPGMTGSNQREYTADILMDGAPGYDAVIVHANAEGVGDIVAAAQLGLESTPTKFVYLNGGSAPEGLEGAKAFSATAGGGYLKSQELQRLADYLKEL